MTWTTILKLSVTLATISLVPTAVFAQFPGPPPMGPGGPPPIAAGGPPAFGGHPPIGPGGAARAGFGGPAPRLGASPGPRGDVRALGGVRTAGRGGPRGCALGSGSLCFGQRQPFRKLWRWRAAIRIRCCLRCWSLCRLWLWPLELWEFR